MALGSRGGWVALALVMPACCVSAATRVRTPTGEVEAGSLVVGDELVSIDLAEDRVVVGRVVQVRRALRECLRLRWPGGALVCTPDHPLYDAERGDYRPASDFVTGDARRLRTSDGAVEVTEVEAYVGVHEVVDISVDAAPHNFVASGVVVHNKSFSEYTVEGMVEGPRFSLSAAEREREFLLRLCGDGGDFDMVDTDLAIEVTGTRRATGDVVRLAGFVVVEGPQAPFVDTLVPGSFKLIPEPTSRPCSEGFVIRLRRTDDTRDGAIAVTWGAHAEYHPESAEEVEVDAITLTIEG